VFQVQRLVCMYVQGLACTCPTKGVHMPNEVGVYVFSDGVYVCKAWFVCVCKAWRARVQQKVCTCPTKWAVSVIRWCVCGQGLVRTCSTTGVHVPNKADV
jgi:hypothetical protein